MEYDRPTVLKFAREIFGSYEFQAKNEQEKTVAFNLIINHPSVRAAGVSVDDISWLYLQQIEFTTATLDKFGRDPIFAIMSKCRPVDVPVLARLNRNFARVARQATLFQQLLSVHYPNAFQTLDPKRQYLALASWQETSYLVRRGKNGRFYLDSPVNGWTSFSDPVRVGPTAQPWLKPGFKYPSWHLRDRQRWQKILQSGHIPKAILELINTLSLNLPPESSLKQYQLEALPDLLVNYFTSVIDNKPEVGNLFSSQDYENMLNEGVLTKYDIDEYRGDEFTFNLEIRVKFSIWGCAIPAGTVAWLLISDSHTALGEDTVEVFKSKEDLAKSFVQSNYDHLLENNVEAFRDDFLPKLYNMEAEEEAEADHISRLSYEDPVSIPQFQAFLRELNIPSPFTKANLYDFVLTHDDLHFYPDSKRDVHYFRKVVF